MLPASIMNFLGNEQRASTLVHGGGEVMVEGEVRNWECKELVSSMRRKGSMCPSLEGIQYAVDALMKISAESWEIQRLKGDG